jgi:hypothetical protein
MMSPLTMMASGERTLGSSAYVPVAITNKRRDQLIVGDWVGRRSVQIGYVKYRMRHPGTHWPAQFTENAITDKRNTHTRRGPMWTSAEAGSS